MTKKSKLSVIINAKNEEAMIGDCLESVKWADEIVLVDDNSTDKTCEIGKRYDAKIVKIKNDSFSSLRNFGAQQTKGDWLLYVDADERVTPLLRQEIIKILQSPVSSLQSPNAFAIPRRNIRLGKEMRFGGWWPDYVLRLMKKEKLERWEGELHEQPKIKGEVGKLENALVHLSHRGSLDHKMANTINWSKTEAKLLFEANHPKMTTTRFLSAMGREFYKRMIKHQAWRDGMEGTIEATYQVFSVFMTYVRLWERQRI